MLFCKAEMDHLQKHCQGPCRLPGVSASRSGGVLVGCGARVYGAAQRLQKDVAEELVEMCKAGAGMSGEELKSVRLR